MKRSDHLRPFLAPLAIASLLGGASAEARTISTQAASNQKTPIAVEVGTGHTIDFSQTGEQVFRGWLGDGGRCLRLSPSSPLENGATIINLQRITPCQKVTGLPVVSETTLTLVTLDPAGSTSIYEFSIDYGAGGDSLTRLVPSIESPEPARPVALRRTNLSVVSIEVGLSTFDLSADSPLSQRVHDWLEAVERGEDQRSAAQDIDLDWALLERLESAGQANTLLGEAFEL